MAVAVQKRDGESNDRLIARWRKKFQQARVTDRVRASMYFVEPENVTKQRGRAIMREKFRAERRRNQFYS